MIIMINGAFGVGKTSVAEELKSRIEGSILFDPEMVGYLLREMLPVEIRQREAKTGDFQDFILWKNLVVEVAEELMDTYHETLIVPMTIYNQERFEYIYNGFKKIDAKTYHFCLMAEKETISDRLLNRGEEEGNWCFQQTERCLDGFRSGTFDEYIQTDKLNIVEITEHILSRLEI
ncbi:AAA family ATPase [Falsibacillus pallidus]|uniref:AAA domain-containing protein n=1 Tax=Falsibacillus pallidus TaxID=493781 RepID=A0A370GQ93_9BACI|nr:AAA family ATPase [Falsibacillus pallidus]RDI45490.1 AAA domain-containing protein [Falsibacillus pallidus]